QVREEVTYTVTTHVDNIFGMTSFGFEDQVDALLKITAGSAVVKVDGDSIVKPGELTVIGNKITFSKTSDFNQIKGKDVVLEFKASIDACVICGEVKSVYPDGKIPNTAQLVYNGQKTSSNTVTIAPPAPVVPQISKDVNGKSHENLVAADDSFDYHVKVLLPQLAVGERYQSLVIEDTLEAVLEIQDTAVLIDGVAVPALDAFVSIAGQKVTLTLVEADFDFDDIIGKVIALEITAVIRPGADLSIYEGELVPNDGDYSIKANEKVKSNRVTVTPPPDEPDIDKDVNGKSHEDLGSKDELFTYHVLIDIPESVRGYESIVVSDTLESVLEIVSSKVRVGTDEDLLAPYLTVSGQTATLVLDNEFDFSQIAGEQIVIELVARIRTGANLDAYPNDSVPNQAGISFNDQPEVKTEPVTVTPPAGTPVIEKDVNGKEHEDLALFSEVFTYHVDMEIPNNTRDYASLIISDTLKDVLEIIDAQVLLDGDDESNLTPFLVVSGQTVSLSLDETYDYSLLSKKTIRLVIQARIRAGADLSAYERETVPNVASYLINDQIDGDSNIVTVTPPLENPTIEKDVNGKTHEDLAARYETFIYHVFVDLPDYTGRYDSLVISDTLEDVLERGGVQVLVDGLPDAGLTARLVFDGQTIRLTLGQTDLGPLAGKQIQLQIEASIRDGADLSAYTDDTVPNQASVGLNHDPQIMSNRVTVTPPPEEVTIVKDVNGKTHEDLDSKGELFVYHVEVEIPGNVRGYESLVIRDTLEDVLRVMGAGILLDGVENEDLTNRISKLGQTLSLTLGEEDFAGLAGKTITLAILARIREGADLTGYEGSTVPNQGSVQLNDSPEQMSNIVTVTPPPEEPDIVKTVDGKEHLDLEEKDQIFNYQVMVEIPYDVHGYESLVIRDTLEDVLQAVDARILLDGVEDAALTARISELGQTLSLALGEDDFAGLAGRTVT
ncbi:MAG: isopeptide-forming domain-containing fimbrial protein, partial [Clostridiaceae bacterium]|nr:isopeptide-forming domain-containing fimbrial protein [Clostridiaceae bacterium]